MMLIKGYFDPMDMFRVLVVAIAWWPGSEDDPGALMVYAPEGQIPSRKLTPGESARGTAERLAAEMRPQVDLGMEYAPEPVSFMDSEEGHIALVFTSVAAPAATLLDAKGSVIQQPTSLGWTGLDHATAMSSSGVVQLVRNYWRQQLGETTAVLDFLPKYFTTSQVRSIYDSVWGSPQDPGNFHRWLHKQNPHFCIEVDVERDVVRDRDRAVETHLKEKGESAGYLVAFGAALVGMAGASPLPLMRAASPIGAGIGLAAALAGSRVAYQATRHRGPRPQWYTREEPVRTHLAALYGPRPAWKSRSSP